jgi:2-polyprenyl-3-methyl-5-hydroxy-6-metoxy-1,4-benzoquinol methylase
MTGDDLRFQFGKNWSRFLSVLDADRIAVAERSLVDMLELPDLHGLTFLDAGSGSGLFSLAAKRLGAARVHSFDYDSHSVACTRELKCRFVPDDPTWTVEQGSVLDESYIRSLGSFDIVYSWGVLHHTGDMWRALETVMRTVHVRGRLFIALYNDQGAASRRWLVIKRLYNRSWAPVRLGLVLAVGGGLAVRAAARGLLGLRRADGAGAADGAEKRRGMSAWYDLVDWVGGYPFEVAKPEEVIAFCRARGFAPCRISTVGTGLANNQFVFARTAD